MKPEISETSTDKNRGKRNEKGSGGMGLFSEFWEVWGFSEFGYFLELMHYFMRPTNAEFRHSISH